MVREKALVCKTRLRSDAGDPCRFLAMSGAQLHPRAVVSTIDDSNAVGAPRVRARTWTPEVRPLSFELPSDRESAPGVLGDYVVRAVSLATHAAMESVCFERASVVETGVLAAAVADGPSRAAAGELRRPWPVRRRACGRCARSWPSRPLAARTVYDGRDVQPALARPDVRDVGDPGLVRNREVSLLRVLAIWATDLLLLRTNSTAWALDSSVNFRRTLGHLSSDSDSRWVGCPRKRGSLTRSKVAS